MPLVADDLLCTTCEGYVHPFLSACPGCGSQRAGRYGQAIAAGRLGAAANLADEATLRAAAAVAMRYSLRTRMPETVTDVRGAFAVIAESIPYAAAVAADGSTPVLPAGATSAGSAKLHLVEGILAVRSGSPARPIAEIPLAAVLAATPIVKGAPPASAWVGPALGEHGVLPQRPLASADLLVTFSVDGVAGQVGLSNERGLLAQKARSEHYVTLARWLGILAAAAAEARWMDLGVPQYAAELGLAAPTEDAGPARDAAALDAAARNAAARAPATAGAPVPSAPAPDAAAPPGTPDPGVRAALEELEDLRGAGLVTADEYDAKRREILARL